MRLDRVRAAIVRDGRLLMVRHRESRRHGAYWTLPGGGIERGETPEDALRREVEEETGLDARIDRLLFTFHARVGIHGVFLAHADGEPVLGYDPEAFPGYEQLIGIEWRDLDDERDDFMVSRVRKALRDPEPAHLTRSAYGFVTRGTELCVFTHRDEPGAGVQVPGGGLELNEDPIRGVEREVFEETGLRARVLRHLATFDHDREDGPRFVLGYHMAFDEPAPDWWEHGEMSYDEPIPFCFFWMDVRNPGLVLWPFQARFLPALRARLEAG